VVPAGDAIIISDYDDINITSEQRRHALARVAGAAALPAHPITPHLNRVAGHYNWWSAEGKC
jgi:hypothetical protein